MSDTPTDECEKACGGTRICLAGLSDINRRRLIAALGTSGGASLAGCVGLFAQPEPKRQPKPEGPIETHDVEFLKQERSIEIDSDEFLLKAGEDAGFDLPFWCRSGLCGACLAKVDGDGHELVHMTNNEFEDLDDEAISEGYVLTCTGQPRADFAMETGVTGALQPTPTPTATPEEGEESAPAKPLPGQRLVFADDVTIDDTSYSAGDVVTADSLTAPHAALAYPEERRVERDAILIHKLEPDKIEAPTNLDMVDQGFVAYSAICTHFGCVSEWSEQGGPRDFCACHDAYFDPYRGAEVLTGPAPRPLPQIGVRVNDDDELELTTEFEGGG